GGPASSTTVPSSPAACRGPGPRGGSRRGRRGPSTCATSSARRSCTSAATTCRGASWSWSRCGRRARTPRCRAGSPTPCAQPLAPTGRCESTDMPPSPAQLVERALVSLDVGREAEPLLCRIVAFGGDDVVLQPKAEPDADQQTALMRGVESYLLLDAGND